MTQEQKSTWRTKVGLAEMLKGGVIMDVTNAEQAKIAEEAGAVAVMALERVPADIRKEGGVARMADPLKLPRHLKGRQQPSRRRPPVRASAEKVALDCIFPAMSAIFLAKLDTRGRSNREPTAVRARVSAKSQFAPWNVPRQLAKIVAFLES